MHKKFKYLVEYHGNTKSGDKIDEVSYITADSEKEIIDQIRYMQDWADLELNIHFHIDNI